MEYSFSQRLSEPWVCACELDYLGDVRDDIFCLQRYGCGLLCYAIECDAPGVVRWLLDKGANNVSWMNHALRHLIECGDYEDVATILLGAGAHVQQTMIQRARDLQRNKVHKLLQGRANAHE